RPSPVTGRGTVRTANESEPRTPHRVCRWWAWNRPYQREATPCLPIESLRDWLNERYDAGLLDNAGCGGCVGFIPALKHGAFSSIFRNYLAIDYEDGESELYPGNVLKEDKHYFTREEYQTEGENGPSKRAQKARQKLSRRKDHFLHTLSKHIVERCVEEDVGRIAVGDLSDIREDQNGDSRNWGMSGNKKLHGWEFDRFTRLLEYKAEEHGILVDRVDEGNTSKTCSCCGQIRDSNRVERGLYVCESCETTLNADVNGAVNIRRRITQSPPLGDMSNGWLAQPGVFLFDRESGSFNTREQGDCKP
uniref:RNA-guided endonuclease InsQ/TnpB family protein n=1 Tax=Halobaculum sp. EA56 TaxID=3421648 RepID=UPI003EC13F3D